MKVLIIGGNRFFGRQLAAKWIADGAHVTLLNRGNFDDGLGEAPERLRCDRTNATSLEHAVFDRQWDVIYDQVAYFAQEARDACRIFKGKTDRYIVTSTISVYNFGASIPESMFNPHDYEFDQDVTEYGEAKRQVESVFFQRPPFRVIAPRFPIVCGQDDYTGRLKFHVEHVARGERIYFPNLDARMSFISSEQAAACLKFLATVDFEGPVNCTAPDATRMRDIIEWTEAAVGKRAVLSASEDTGEHSPYGVPQDWFASPRLLSSLGFRTEPLVKWLPPLLAEIAREI